MENEAAQRLRDVMETIRQEQGKLFDLQVDMTSKLMKLLSKPPYDVLEEVNKMANAFKVVEK